MAGQKYQRPGKVLRLPAGRYRVEQVELDGGYVSWGGMAQSEQWFDLAPGESQRLVVGAPLTQHVDVSRHGKFLEMSYQLTDQAGREYSHMSESEQLPDPPRFTAYKGNRVLGSDSFAYG